MTGVQTCALPIFFLAALEKEIQRSERFGHPFAVILLDVDRLADINARHGAGTAFAFALDVTQEDQWRTALEAANAAMGGISVLLNNAGISGMEQRPDEVQRNYDITMAQMGATMAGNPPSVHLDVTERTTDDDWHRVLAVHLDGAFLTTKAVLPTMYAQGGGSIIYMGSIHSKEASPFKAPYVTAKHGLLGLARVVAKEGGKRGVRANVICPGYVWTPLVEKQIPEQARTRGISEERVIKEVMLKDTFDGEFTTTADVAAATLFFASFDSAAISGQSINVKIGRAHV